MHSNSLKWHKNVEINHLATFQTQFGPPGGILENQVFSAFKSNGFTSKNSGA